MTVPFSRLRVGDEIRFRYSEREPEQQGTIVKLVELGSGALRVRSERGEQALSGRRVTGIVRYKLSPAQRATLEALARAGADGIHTGGISIKGDHLANRMPVKTLRKLGFQVSPRALAVLADRGLVEGVMIQINDDWGNVAIWGLSAEGRRVTTELLG